MAKDNILIKNARIVNADRIIESADILIKDGKIAEIGTGFSTFGCEIIEAKGMIVMPGGIDPHVHQDMPFMGTYSEGWEHTTAAAVAGGTTCVIDFIIPGKNDKLLDTIATWDKNSAKSRCDYSYHMCVVNENQIEQLKDVVDKGITSLKCFMAYKNALMLDDATLIKSFTKCKELGVLVSVHAENGELVVAGQHRIYNSGITGPEGHCMSRPNHHEYEACERAIVYAEDVNTPLCIVHNTTSGSVDAIRRAQARGSRVFGEATIAHLALTEEKYFHGSFDERAACVLSPPLRSEADQKSLWNGLAGGVLCNIVTDHCGFTIAQKSAGKGDFRKIPNGCPGLEERMPVAWTLGVNTGKITMQQFVALTSTNTAKMYNMYPRKGVVEVGADADLIIWDPAKSHTISAKNHHSSLDINPFEGFNCVGYPSYVIAGGHLAVKDDVVLVQPGHGKFVSRRPFGYAFEGMDLKQKEIDRALIAKSQRA